VENRKFAGRLFVEPVLILELLDLSDETFKTVLDVEFHKSANVHSCFSRDGGRVDARFHAPAIDVSAVDIEIAGNLGDTSAQLQGSDYLRLQVVGMRYATGHRAALLLYNEWERKDMAMGFSQLRTPEPSTERTPTFIVGNRTLAAAYYLTHGASKLIRCTISVANPDDVTREVQPYINTLPGDWEVVRQEVAPDCTGYRVHLWLGPVKEADAVAEAQRIITEDAAPQRHGA
jgi:hypothetical protein